MRSDETKLEIKVGAMLTAAALGIVALLYLMGEIRIGSGSQVRVDFGHTGNVVKGAPVKLGGVGVGVVDSIALSPERRDQSDQPLPVTMTLSISKAALASLRQDTSVTVSSQGPLGEPYIELWPGIAAKTYDPSSNLRGIDAPRLDIVSNRLAKFLESASKVLESDPDALSRLVSGLGSLTVTADGVLKENRDELSQMSHDLVAAIKDLRALSALARQQVEPGGKAHALIDDAAAVAKLAKTELPEITKKANQAATGAAAVAGQLTEEDGQRLKAMIAKYQHVGETLDGIAAKADRLVARIEAGDGTLGALAKDKQVYDDLKSLLADLRKHPWKMLWKD